MATSLRRNRSRRRIAAITFLSNISLDGSYRDTKLSLLPRNGAFVKNDLILLSKANEILAEEDDEPDDCFSDYEAVLATKSFSSKIKKRLQKTRPYHTDGQSLSSESDSVITPIKMYLEDPFPFKNTGSYKERTPLSTTDSGTEEKKVTTKHHKKTMGKTRYFSNTEQQQIGSSSESIGPGSTLTQSKISPTSSTTVLEGAADKELKVTKNSKKRKFKGERIAMVTNARNPVLVCSFIPYLKNQKARSDTRREVCRKRHISGSRPLSTVGDGLDLYELLGIEKDQAGQEVSYEKLLVPTKPTKEIYEKRQNVDENIDSFIQTSAHSRHVVARCFSYDQAVQRGTIHTTVSSPPDTKDDISTLVYSPHLLDDPELSAGKHRTLLTFTSYMTSVIDYVRPADLKKEINDKFKDRFPHIQLTLSKLRSIKKEMRKIAKTEPCIELLIVAQAYVYFEKLILRGLINKQNRKLCAAASLLLSAKLNDVKGDNLKALIERTENVFRLSRKDLFASEFAVLVALEFGLHIPNWEIFPHYQRLMYES